MYRGSVYDSVSVLPNGEVSVPGVDFGSRIRQERRIEDRALWVWPGHNAWGGIGLRYYHPTRYMLVKYLDASTVEVVEEVEPGRRWGAAKKRMLTTVHEGGI